MLGNIQTAALRDMGLLVFFWTVTISLLLTFVGCIPDVERAKQDIIDAIEERTCVWRETEPAIYILCENQSMVCVPDLEGTGVHICQIQ